MKFDFAILTKPTYEALVTDAKTLGEQGWEAFQFDPRLPSQNGTTLGLFLRKYIEEPTAAQPQPDPPPQPAPPPPTADFIPEPGADPTPAAAPTPQPQNAAAASGQAAAGVEHPLVQAGVPPKLVDEINLIAQIRGVNPKQWIMEALMRYVSVEWDLMEQDGLVTIAADGSRHINPQTPAQ